MLRLAVHPAAVHRRFLRAAANFGWRRRRLSRQLLCAKVGALSLQALLELAELPLYEIAPTGVAAHSRWWCASCTVTARLRQDARQAVAVTPSSHTLRHAHSDQDGKISRSYLSGLRSVRCGQACEDVGPLLRAADPLTSNEHVADAEPAPRPATSPAPPMDESKQVHPAQAGASRQLGNPMEAARIYLTPTTDAMVPPLVVPVPVLVVSAPAAPQWPPPTTPGCAESSPAVLPTVERLPLAAAGWMWRQCWRRGRRRLKPMTIRPTQRPPVAWLGRRHPSPA
jgi:hypothetical protein